MSINYRDLALDAAKALSVPSSKRITEVKSLVDGALAAASASALLILAAASFPIAVAGGSLAFAATSLRVQGNHDDGLEDAGKRIYEMYQHLGLENAAERVEILRGKTDHNEIKEIFDECIPQHFCESLATYIMQHSD
eukprot:Rmarinus@m.14803